MRKPLQEWNPGGKFRLELYLATPDWLQNITPKRLWQGHDRPANSLPTVFPGIPTPKLRRSSVQSNVERAARRMYAEQQVAVTGRTHVPEHGYLPGRVDEQDIDAEVRVASLTVFKFSTPEGAQEAVGALEALQQQNLIKVDDYATVSWPIGSKKPTTRQGRDTVGAAALDGTFWGMLFGLLFFLPFLGAAIGAAAGALRGALTDVGINDAFINSVKSKVTPGTSALFLLSEEAVVDRVAQRFQQLPPHELIASNLSAEQEAKLRAAFA